MIKALVVKHERRRAKPLPGNANPTSEGSDPSVRTTMNFNVSEEFHREFKIYAAQHGLKMVEVLERSFRLLKDSNGS